MERLFERYRRRGDRRALAKVFDRAAPELLRVAMHVARDPAEAEDLVQATFLTAIERAERFEAGRRLMPWLAGILVNHARDAARRARRTVDGARLPTPEDEAPDAAAARREARDRVLTAVDALEDPYREVVALKLLHDLEPAAIAHALGRAPATVRSQLHRGLERLRRRLPAGLAVAALGVIPPARGLAAVRAEVLAAGVVGNAVAAGGALMGTKAVVLAAAVLLALSAAAYRFSTRTGDDVARAAAPVRSPAVEARGRPLPPASPSPARAGEAAGAGPGNAVERALTWGILVDPEGHPLRKSLPVLASSSGQAPLVSAAMLDPEWLRSRRALFATGASDVEGRFELDLPCSDGYAIHSLDPDWILEHDELIGPGERDVRVSAHPAHAIEGRIVDATTGEPVPEPRANFLRRLPGGRGTSMLGLRPRGKLLLVWKPDAEEVALGCDVDVTVEAEGYHTTRERLSFAPGEVPARRVVEMRLPRVLPEELGYVDVEVFDSRGRPYDRPLALRLKGEPPPTTQRAEEVGPGRYRLRAFEGTWPLRVAPVSALGDVLALAWSGDVSLSKRGGPVVRCDLPPCGWLRVKLAASEDVFLHVAPAADDSWSGVFGSLGGEALFAAAPGDWMLGLQDPPDRRASVREGEETVVDLLR
jgi:RNA polymerase sigma-70 factor (ECF subfamily)